MQIGGTLIFFAYFYGTPTLSVDLSVLPSLTTDFDVWWYGDIYEVTRRRPPLSVQFWRSILHAVHPSYVHLAYVHLARHTSTKPPASLPSSRPPCEPVTLWPSIHRHACTTPTSPGDGATWWDLGWWMGEPSQPVALLPPCPPLTMAHYHQPLRISCRCPPVHRWQPVHLFTCPPPVRFSTFRRRAKRAKPPEGVTTMDVPGQATVRAVIAQADWSGVRAVERDLLSLSG